MAIGPGKYDDALTLALRTVVAREPHIHGGVLLVMGPPDEADSCGFSVQLTLAAMRMMPALLRFMADGIEADLATGAAFMPGRRES